MCSCLFIFSNGCQLFIFFFFFFSFSLSPSPLHILHNSTLFSLYKNLSPLFLFLTPFDSLISQTLSFSLLLSSSSSMAHKAKKSSYVLSSNAFHLTRWSGATRLMGPPPLTYQPENHIPMGKSVSFSFFSHFQVTF